MKIDDDVTPQKCANGEMPTRTRLQLRIEPGATLTNHDSINAYAQKLAESQRAAVTVVGGPDRADLTYDGAPPEERELGLRDADPGAALCVLRQDLPPLLAVGTAAIVRVIKGDGTVSHSLHVDGTHA